MILIEKVRAKRIFLSPLSAGKTPIYDGFHPTPFPFHFLVYLHLNLVSLLLAQFSTRMATEMISQMIECYQFSSVDILL